MKKCVIFTGNHTSYHGIVAFIYKHQCQSEFIVNNTESDCILSRLNI